jgi:hypothetical protein
MKKLLCREIVGKTVRLLREIQNGADSVFPVGLEMKVEGTYRGGFTLKHFDPCHQCKCRGWSSVSRVKRDAFEIVENIEGSSS